MDHEAITHNQSIGRFRLLWTSLELAMSHDGPGKATVTTLATSVTMGKAIKTTTTPFPDEVLKAELESEDGNVLYEVEIVNAAGEIRRLKLKPNREKF